MSTPPKKPTADESLDWAEQEEEDSPPLEIWPVDEGPEFEEDWGLQSTETNEDPPFDDMQDSASDEDLEFSENPIEPTVVGHKEHASLPDHGIHLILARFSTDTEFSSLHAAIQQSTQDRVIVHLDQVQLELTTHEVGENLVVRDV